MEIPVTLPVCPLVCEPKGDVPSVAVCSADDAVVLETPSDFVEVHVMLAVCSDSDPTVVLLVLIC